MKKITVILCAVLMAAVCLLGTGCGKAKYADSKYLGKWAATKASYAGMELAVEDIIGGEFSFDLNEAGIVTLVVVDEEKSGNWEQTTDGIVFKGEEDLRFVEEGDKLVADYGGVKLTFERTN